MIDLQAVKIGNYENIKLDFGITGRNEVLQNLSVLYTTPVGTVPFDREFGVDTEIVDLPIDLAKGRLIVEYTEKTRKYEPRATVLEVTFETDPQKGVLIPKVVINIDAKA